ncbi:MmgE/PrpD family protein [Chloroflexota bacterium]
MGVTAQMSRFIVETRFEDIPGEAIRRTKKQFLDCLGTALAGYEDEVGRIVTEYTREIGGTAESRLLGSGVFTSAANAAFANGTMAHALDFDDCGFTSHPTGCILPVLLALGEKLRLSGKEILVAQVMGYECLEGLSYGARAYDRTLRARGYHPTPVYGTLAAAATAAKLLKLNVTETSMALGMAGSQAAGLIENFGTMAKGSHSGNAARAGVLAASLVQKGYVATQEVIEGQHGLYHAIIGEGNYNLSKVTEKMGKTWAIIDPGLSIKTYPCCHGNARALDAILQILNEHNISFEQVESVEVMMNRGPWNSLRFDKPAAGDQGKFSMQYNMATAILDGKVDIDSFSDDKANSPEMREALSKIKVVDMSEWTSDVERRRTPVKVRMKNGQEYTGEVDKPRGNVENPLTDEILQEKFRYCAGRVPLPPSRIERCIALVQEMENISDITLLMDMTYPQ